MEGKPEFRSQRGNQKNAKSNLCGSVLISQTLATPQDGPQGGAQVSQIRKPNQSRLRCPNLYAVAAFPKWVGKKMSPFPLFSTGFSAVQQDIH
jgi:hypothetical protein